MTRAMKLIIWATVVAVLPFFVFLGEWTNTYENGVLVDRYWVNFAAIFGGLGAVVCSRCSLCAVRAPMRSGSGGCRRWRWA